MHSASVCVHAHRIVYTCAAWKGLAWSKAAKGVAGYVQDRRGLLYMEGKRGGGQGGGAATLPAQPCCGSRPPWLGVLQFGQHAFIIDTSFPYNQIHESNGLHIQNAREHGLQNTTTDHRPRTFVKP